MPQAKKRIRYVDGFAIRNVFPDMDVVESHSTSGDRRDGMPTPFVPEGEIWIDRRFRKERAFLLELHAIEQRMRGRPYAEVRAHLKEKLTRKSVPPDFVVRTLRRGGLRIRYVRGEIVRRYLDPCFIFGGHDLVYGYVPKGEIWLDVRQDPREMKYTLSHELHERRLMSRGWSYLRAHRSATDAERALRRREFTPKRRPLRLVPFRQSAGFCGPASLKIVCARFGREYDEMTLGDLCGTTAADGTDHAGLIAGAKALGATVMAKSKGTIAELRRLVSRRRLPVIVGWYSPSTLHKREFVPEHDAVEDHFSVVYHVSATHVYMMDPETDSGRRRMTIERFKKLWWDTDGPNYRRVERWFIMVDFSGKPGKT